MPLRFYNTLTQQVEDFSPARDNTVRMYTCGPTVYDFAHIGNFRSFTFVDLLRKVLRLNGFALDHVMNITDVDDKIIRNAVAQHKSIDEFTAIYTQAFLDDCAALRLERPERLSKATEHIDEMVHAIEDLEKSGHTYSSEGSVYFKIATFPGYGKLSHNDFSGNLAGARVDVDYYEKADARDFALWKAPKEGEPFWKTEIGPGRPGWHIECSVMAIKYLGETLDIHAGGIDLVFPHHENEIAQSESLTGKPFARFWLHAEFLLVEGQKMSKSLGNFYTLRDLIAKGYAPEAIRYLLASVPYRKQLNFTMDGLKAAVIAIDRLRNFKLRLETDRFSEGLNPSARRAHGTRVAAPSSTPSTTTSIPPKPSPPSSSTCATSTAPWMPANSAPATSRPRWPSLSRFDSVLRRAHRHRQKRRDERRRRRGAHRRAHRRQKGEELRAAPIRSAIELLAAGHRPRRHQGRRPLEEEIGTLQIHTKAVHAGDRKKSGPHTPVTTPIHTATSYFYDSMAQLDRIFGQ